MKKTSGIWNLDSRIWTLESGLWTLDSGGLQLGGYSPGLPILAPHTPPPFIFCREATVGRLQSHATDFGSADALTGS